MLRAEEAQLGAERRVLQAEFMLPHASYDIADTMQLAARELEAVRAQLAAEEARADPAATAASAEPATSGVRAGALLLDCIAEAREAAAAAEAAAEEAKSEEADALKQSWTCTAVINPPSSGQRAAQPRHPARPPGVHQAWPWIRHAARNAQRKPAQDARARRVCL